MMISRSFRRLVVVGVQNYWRNIGLTIATTVVMSLTLFLISVVILLNIVGIISISTVKEKVDVSVYFSSSASEVQIQKTRVDIEAIPEVTSVDYITQEQALAQFKEKYKNNPIISQSLAELSQNPLQPTLIIKAGDPNQYEKIRSFLEVEKQQGIIERINFDDNRAVIERLDQGVTIVRNGGAILTVIFVLIAIIVMFNTIRLTIFSRSKEITIMKLVGATNWYIRTPFIIEGVMYGLFASILAFALTYPLMTFLGPKLESFFGIASKTTLLDFLIANALINFGVLLAIGLVLGTFSSFIAIRRHLKV